MRLKINRQWRYVLGKEIDKKGGVWYKVQCLHDKSKFQKISSRNKAITQVDNHNNPVKQRTYKCLGEIDKAKIIIDYRKGDCLTEIAKMHKTTYDTVRRVVIEYERNKVR